MMPNIRTSQAVANTASNAAFDSRRSGKKIKSPFWLPINVESYRADTADLSTLEHGAFLLMRMHYWRTGPLKDDDRILARITGLSNTDWKLVRPCLERFFNIDSQWINWEWDKELGTAYDHIQKASDAGKKAAEARWKKERDRKAGECETDTNRIRSAFESDTNRYANYKLGGSPPTTPYLASDDL